MENKKKERPKNRISKHLGKVSIAIITASLMASPACAVDPLDPVQAAGQVVASEGGQQAAKAALNSALKVARGKPALSLATTIVCVTCVPVAGAAASPGMCIACGILIAKVIG